MIESFHLYPNQGNGDVRDIWTFDRHLINYQIELNSQYFHLDFCAVW